MVYFQPETMLRDLGADGSSPVSSVSLVMMLGHRRIRRVES